MPCKQVRASAAPQAVVAVASEHIIEGRPPDEDVVVPRAGQVVISWATVEVVDVLAGHDVVMAGASERLGEQRIHVAELVRDTQRDRVVTAFSIDPAGPTDLVVSVPGVHAGSGAYQDHVVTVGPHDPGALVQIDDRCW
jgi:hypothetical protein